MSEQLRSAPPNYEVLKMLGVEGWLPREPLPAAAPSADWVWEYGKGASTAETAPQPRVSQPLQSATESTQNTLGARQALSAMIAPEIKPKPKPDKPVVPSTRTERVAASAPVAEAPVVPPVKRAEARSTAPSIRFKLAVSCYRSVLVIDSLPPEGYGDFSPHHQRILCSMIRSFVPEQSHDRFEPPTILPWPPFSFAPDPGREAAEGAVKHLLDKKIAQWQPRLILMMGEAAAQVVLSQQESLEAMRGIRFNLSQGIPALATASLGEALTVPGCKADIWADLQKIRDLFQ